MTDTGRKKKMSRRELFTSLRPEGLGQWADRWRSGLADSLDKHLPNEEPTAGKTPSPRKAGTAAPEDLPGRALEAISLDQPDEAIVALRPYVKQNPKDREARLLLGRVLYADGAFVQSRVEFERIIRDSREESLGLWPASCASLCLACALARCGKLDKAAAALHKYMDEDRPQAADTVTRLAQAMDAFARKEKTPGPSVDADVDGLVRTLENYVEAAYPTRMEMAADLASGEPPGKPDSAEPATA